MKICKFDLSYKKITKKNILLKFYVLLSRKSMNFVQDGINFTSSPQAWLNLCFLVIYGIQFFQSSQLIKDLPVMPS